jgi:hypothetical protein
MTVLTDWTPESRAAFGQRGLAFQHTLAERPMFSDEGLASVLDRYPRDRLGVFTMGSDLTDTSSWRRGSAGKLSGDQLLAAVQSGRIWLNLRDTDKHLPDYAALQREIVAEKERVLRTTILKPDLGLLISSPEVEVFYHLDVPLSSLWQLRGEKCFRLYPRAEPYVADAEIERFVLREAEGQFDFDPAWDADAERYVLTPGVMVTWPQNAPHRVSNGPMMNVSLSMEFMTPAALFRANLMYANGLMRRWWGWRPKVQTRFGPTALSKLLLARTVKAIRSQHKRAYTPILKPSFTLESQP